MVAQKASCIECCLPSWSWLLRWPFVQPCRPQQKGRSDRLQVDLDWDYLSAFWTSRCSLALPLRYLEVLLRLGPYVARLSAIQSGGHAPSVTAEQFTSRIEQLGPCFVKLGRALAAPSSGGLAASCRAFGWRNEGNIFNWPSAPLPDVAAAQRVLSTDLPVQILEALEIPKEREGPISVTPFAQVFHRRFRGEDVAVKVQREGVRELLALDLLVLRKLANTVDRTDFAPGTRGRFAQPCFIPALAACARVPCREANLLGHMAFSICGSVTGTALTNATASIPIRETLEGWAQDIWAELDYQREAANQDWFCKEVVSHIKGVQVPHVCWAATVGRVLTTKFVTGVRLGEATCDATLRFHGVHSFEYNNFDVDENMVTGKTSSGTNVPRHNLVAAGLVTAPESLPAASLLSLSLQVSSLHCFAAQRSETSCSWSSLASSASDPEEATADRLYQEASEENSTNHTTKQHSSQYAAPDVFENVML